ERGQLRPLPHADGGAEAVGEDRPAVAPGAACRADHGRRLAHRPSAQSRGLRDHRGGHRPLQAGDGGRAGATGRGLRLHRSSERRARLVPGERWIGSTLQGPRPGAGVRDPLGSTPDDRGEDAGRPHPDVRHHQHDRRRGGAVSASDGKKPTGDAQPALPAAKPPPTPPTPGGKPAPKHPGFVTVTVDGKELVAKPAENMVDAVKKVGADIPYYCYHPRLTIAANCRMCLVEVSNSPKPVPASPTPMAEGI